MKKEETENDRIRGEKRREKGRRRKEVRKRTFGENRESGGRQGHCGRRARGAD